MFLKFALLFDRSRSRFELLYISGSVHHNSLLSSILMMHPPDRLLLLPDGREDIGDEVERQDDDWRYIRPHGGDSCKLNTLYAPGCATSGSYEINAFHRVE